MKERLTKKENVLIATMLFGLFFGAGNLIFPAYMGQLAGKNMWQAIIGFVITGVGLPLLGIAAMGISRSNGLMELSSKVSRPYSYFFTCALYLTIGPFFAIPRCATTPFTVAVATLMPEGSNQSLALAIFSFLFFAIVLAFSLKPGKILTHVGKILTPIFLVLLAVLVIAALVNPTAAISTLEAQGTYESNAFFTGFLEGYNTMDALACLAFGIVVINVIRGLGVEKPEHVALCTVKAGVSSCLIMAVIYLAVTLVGVQCRVIAEEAGVACANGGEVLSLVAQYYFGDAGVWILAATVTMACLKTSVGLVTSCAETFEQLFPQGPKYKAWAVIFSVVSFVIANLGLSAIIACSVPVLMFLYPLAITLILLGLFGKFFGHSRIVYSTVTGFTFVAALFDFAKAMLGADVLSETMIASLHLRGAVAFAQKALPFFDLGVGWICPALAGLVVGLVWYAIAKNRKAAAAA